MSSASSLSQPVMSHPEKHFSKLPTDEAPRKGRRTRWEQTASEAAATQATTTTATVSTAQAASSAVTEAASDPKSVAAAARAMLAAKAAASGRQLITPSANSVLSDVAARAAAARAALEKAKRALLVKREQMVAIGTGGSSSALLSAGVAAALRNLPRSAPVKFDRLGRELDEEGQVVDIRPVVHSTLKININREREEKLKQVAHQTRVDRNLTNPESNPWFDPSMVGGGIKAKKRGLCFVERGFYANKERKMRNRLVAEAMGFQMSSEAKEAQRQREAAEEEKLRRLLKYQQEGSNKDAIESVELKTEEEGSEEPDEFNPNLIPLGDGINTSEGNTKKEINNNVEGQLSDVPSSDDDGDAYGHRGGRRNHSSLHLLQRQHQLGLIPDVEWWDSQLLQKCAESYDPHFPYIILENNITNLIEHPVPIPSAMDSSKPATSSTILTPKERAKLRRRKRQEKEQDKQHKIRMGLIAPPPPKVKLSNLARVLGTSAAADPSKVEKQVREQMAERLRGHEERNEARRLDDEARRKKTIAKFTRLPNDNSIPVGGARVCVFSVKDLSNKKNYIKVERNAQQFHLTGVAVLCLQVGNLIVVEGTQKALKGFKHLLLHRIKWKESDEEMCAGNHPHEEEENHPLEEHATLKNKGNAYCRLLWEGVVKERGFRQWKIHTFKSEVEARKLLADRQAGHYWDLLKKYRDPKEDF